MQLSKFVNSYKSYLNSSSYLTRLIARIIGFSIIFAVSLCILYLLFGQINFVAPYTYILFVIFSPFYLATVNSNYDGLIIGGNTINVLDVCVGWFELAVFISLILATIDTSLRKRISAILILIPSFLLFNLTRMIVIIYGILNWNLTVVDFLHTLLFKVGLFVFFISFYSIWLYIFCADN